VTDKITLRPGDCMDVLATIAENSIDACVTDPPYHLTSIVKRFGGNGAAPAQFGTDGAYARASSGFMGKQWDGGDIAFRAEIWREVYRVLKPGAHLVAFGGTRTYHRMACAIEDAGFEIRDCIQWLYGSGFPKSHDVSKGIDRAAGAGREVIPTGTPVKRMIPGADQNKAGWEKNNGREYVPNESIPTTDAACQWEGWGTALKPACEPIVLARKPLSERTVAANVLRWGTGAINVDGCRVEAEKSTGWNELSGTRKIGWDRRFDGKNKMRRPATYSGENTGWDRPWKHDETALAEKQARKDESADKAQSLGRWPANVIHDGSDEVVGAFPELMSRSTASVDGKPHGTTFGGDKKREDSDGTWYGDTGSAARFFYTAKADSDDRIGSKHPTVKPIDLMQYLVRLVTPKGGLVLDPFAGSGTTGEAAFREGMRAILIEREAEYLKDIERRIDLLMAGPDERAFKSQKAKQNRKEVDAGPLFGGKSDWDEMWAQPFDRTDLL
jgi:site-specific DNA-methyltransferase (adenine-specific)